jgi:membrane protein
MALDHRSERKTLEAKQRDRGAGDGRGPDSPGDLSMTGKKATLKRTLTEFSNDNLTDRAAALTYYSVMAIFPAIIALISVIGLVGHSLTQTLLDNVDKVAPGPAKEIFTSAIKNVASSKGAAGFAFVIGLVIALNSASSYISGFARASNEIYDVEEGRPVWKLKPQQIGVTLVLLLLVVLITVMVAVSGPLAKEVGKVVGVGSSASTIWDIAKIPIVLAIVSFMFAFLYWTAPNVKTPGFKFVSPGGIVALVIWIIASLLFALYLATFASYAKTYGSLGGVIAFLVWLWVTNVAILFGAEFNAELQRSQQIEAGEHGRFDEPFLEPRDASKLEKKHDKDEKKKEKAAD